jgi:hypothetical protein
MIGAKLRDMRILVLSVQIEAQIERGWLFSCIFGLKDVFSPAKVKCHRKRYNWTFP